MADEAKTTNNPATGAGSVPESIKKFMDDKGQIDVAKLQDSYLALESTHTKTAQKLAETERAYEILATEYEEPTPAPGAGAVNAGREASAGAARPQAVPQTNGGASFSEQRIIEMSHPEVAVDPVTGKDKDPEFMDGLRQYAKTLPVELQKSIRAGNAAHLDWAIRQFKALRGAGSSKGGDGGGSSHKPNFIEGASSGGGNASGKMWTKAEIRTLYTNNPTEYAAKADEIQLAYEEGRVK